MAAAVPVATRAADREKFLAAYTEKIIGAYQPRYDGKVLLRFPRLFILAVKSFALSRSLPRCCSAASCTGRVADAAFQTGCNRCGRRRRRWRVRARPSIWRRARPDLSLPDLVLPGRPERPSGGQAEFVLTPADYLKESTFDNLAGRGRKLFDQYRDTLTAIEKQFGVPPTVCWRSSAAKPTTAATATRRTPSACWRRRPLLGKRKDKFLDEFSAGVENLDEGQVKLADMTSSWAGAMGLTQFMPSDYVKYAVDFDGDGRPNIWTSVPDALASAAKQLQGKGWQRGLRWAYEVHPPADVDCTIGVPENTLPLGEWLKRGYVPAYGRTLSAAERASRVAAATGRAPGLHRRSSSSSRNIFLRSLRAVRRPSFRPHRTRGRSRRRGARWRNCRPPRSGACGSLTDRGFYHDKIDGKAGMRPAQRSALIRSAMG